LNHRASGSDDVLRGKAVRFCWMGPFWLTFLRLVDAGMPCFLVLVRAWRCTYWGGISSPPYNAVTTLSWFVGDGKAECSRSGDPRKADLEFRETARGRWREKLCVCVSIYVCVRESASKRRRESEPRLYVRNTRAAERGRLLQRFLKQVEYYGLRTRRGFLSRVCTGPMLNAVW